MRSNGPFVSMFAKARRRIRTLTRDTRGVSAIEFALVLPVMIVMYIGAVEISHALTVDRRVTAVASAVADLAAQTDKVTPAEVQDIFTAASSIMTPYSATPISIVVTSVIADENNDTTVDWSCAHNGSPYADGAGFTLPDGLTQPFSSVIVAEVSYNYTPPLGHYMTGGLTLTETFYLRPRRSLTVEMQGGGC